MAPSSGVTIAALGRGVVWEMAGQQGQGTETGLSESLEPPGGMGGVTAPGMAAEWSNTS